VPGVGTTLVSYSCRGGIGRNSRAREASASEILTRHRYWRTGYTIVLQAYGPLLESAGKSGLFRGSWFAAPFVEQSPLGLWRKEKAEVEHETL